MTDNDLRAAFAEHTNDTIYVTRRIVIHLAHMADMRPMSMVWRLEKMGLMRKGSWEWFESNGGITKEHVREALGNAPTVL